MLRYSKPEILGLCPGPWCVETNFGVKLGDHGHRMFLGARHVSRRLLHPRFVFQPLNRQVQSANGSSRSIFFRRRPLYKPTTAFGRTYLRLRNFTFGVVTISVTAFSIFYLLDARSAAHRYIFTPALRLVTPDPEDAHRIAVLALKYGLHPKDQKPDDPRLAIEVSSLKLFRLMSSCGEDICPSRWE